MSAVGLVLASIMSIFPAAALAQDIQAGHRIAQMWCGKCHAIGANESDPRIDVVPSFASIARMRSTTATSLNAFLSTPHPPMPDFTLTRQEIADVSAYILSLRPRAGDRT
jgi:mono/diheme cytochrome c family protein